ncbi:MAG TPA: YraN family protein [Acidothermaceae bacterium]|nr:YraN family protein [Acidothermaceae bacterium]
MRSPPEFALEVVGVIRSSDVARVKAGASDRGGLGRYGEEVAAAHLVAAGLTIVARNWRCREGEVDIVALDGDVLVMCEVKTRRGVGFGTPLDAVTPAKAARLRRLAVRWLADQRTGEVTAAAQEYARYAEVRFDVVSVLRPLSGVTSVEHLRGAF